MIIERVNVMQFTINERKIKCEDITSLIGDNADYAVTFAFDEEWEGQAKTARFILKNRYVDVILEDDACTIPVEILKQGILAVGVYAEKITSTICEIPVKPSIKEKAGNVAAPTDDVYAQLLKQMQVLEQGAVSDERISEALSVFMETDNTLMKSSEFNSMANAYLGEKEINKRVDTGMSTSDITPTLVIGGFYFSSAVLKETTYTTYAKSDYMDIGVGKTFKIKLNNSLYKYKVTQFNSNEGTSAYTDYVDGAYLTEDTEITTTKRYVRICVRLVAETNVTLTDAQTALTITMETATQIKEEVLAKSENPLYKASAYYDGDSICYGANSSGNSYPDMIAKRNEMYMTKKAVSGTTIAKRDGYTNSILERVKAMTADYDYIVLEGGYNDCVQKVPLGTITTGYQTDVDESTFIGAMESICKFLCTNYFEKKKLFIVPHRTLNTEVNSYYDSAITVCKKWGIPTIDLRDECNLIPFIGETVQTQYFEGANTGVHPTEQGYRVFYVPKIEGRMKTL